MVHFNAASDEESLDDILAHVVREERRMQDIISKGISDCQTQNPSQS